MKEYKYAYLVGLGGGYEIPRWLGDNKFPEWLECAEWLFVAPGTHNNVLCEFVW
jgi:hypothetical protein